MRKLLVKMFYQAQVRQIFKNNSNQKKIVMLATSSYGNLGDQAIGIACKKYIQDYFSDYEYIEVTAKQYEYAREFVHRNISEDDLITIFGGGFLGTLYPTAQLIVNDILRSFPNNKIIQFPQTIYYENSDNAEDIFLESKEAASNHQYYKLFLRETKSYDFSSANYSEVTTFLVPDIVMYLERPYQFERNGVLFCTRNDIEKVTDNNFLDRVARITQELSPDINITYTDTIIKARPTPKNRDNYVNDKIKEFAKAELVVTDRLHGMIFALITGTPCIALDNSSGKVSAVYEWIKDVDTIKQLPVDIQKSISNSELTDLVKELLSVEPKKYNNEKLTQKLEPLKDQISIALQN